MASLLTDLSTETVHGAVSTRPGLDMALALLRETMGASRLGAQFEFVLDVARQYRRRPTSARPGFYPQGRHTPPLPAARAAVDVQGMGCILEIELSH